MQIKRYAFFRVPFNKCLALVVVVVMHCSRSIFCCSGKVLNTRAFLLNRFDMILAVVVVAAFFIHFHFR